MSDKKKSELKARWTPDMLAIADGAFSGMDAVAAYQGKQPRFPFVSPFGEFEGRTDFRYLELRSTPVYRTIENADLTGATDDRGGQLRQCTLIGCKLDLASMETNLGEKILRCSFVRAKFSHTTFRGEFVDCDFTKCDLSYSLGGQLKFVRCNFTDAKFVGARFQRSLFDNCTWTNAKIGNAAFSHGKFTGGRPSPEQLIDAMYPNAVFESDQGQV